MDFYLNELSLNGQFENGLAFERAMRSILSCQASIQKAGHRLYCDRKLSTCQVYDAVAFQQAILRHPDVNFKRVVSAWIDKTGPFWPDVRMHSEDEYFACGNDVVTNTTLGEVAFRLSESDDARTLSFDPSVYAYTPIIVKWERLSECQDIQVGNFWQLHPLEAFIKTLDTPPRSWSEFVSKCRKLVETKDFKFLDSFAASLDGQPFNASIAGRALFLINILSDIRASLDNQGAYTVRTHELLNNFFTKKALFSDESDTNKNKYAREMTFRLSSDAEIFCPFHGKIKFGRQYRLHHSWPPKGGEPLYIAYLGPKIAKD